MTSKEQAEELAENAIMKFVARVSTNPFSSDKEYIKELLDEIPLTELLEVAKAATEVNRPHTDRNSNYPDGCECEECENWKVLNNRIEALRATKKVEI